MAQDLESKNRPEESGNAGEPTFFVVIELEEQKHEPRPITNRRCDRERTKH